MINSLRTLAFIFTFLISSHVFAQDKVVVIPLLKTTTPTGAAFDGANEKVALTTTTATIRTVVVNVPSTGVVIANASGYMDLNNNPASGIACSITKNSTSYDTNAAIIAGANTAAVRFVPFGATRGFNVTEAGEITLRLVCYGVAGITDINDTNLTVMFFPNKL